MRSIKTLSITLLGLLSAIIFPHSSIAQNNTYSIGFRYRIQSEGEWGSGYPLITQVDPYGWAFVAGFREGELIESIDGLSTKGLSSGQVNELLYSAPQHLLRTRSLSQTLLKLLHLKEIISETYSEKDLALRWGYYSLEDTGNISIDYPFSYTQSADNWGKYKTFSFVSSEEKSKEVDRIIYQLIRRHLLRLGLREEPTNADLIVSTYYSIEPNMSSSNLKDEEMGTYRWIPQNNSIELFPIISPADVSSTPGKYKLHLGIQIATRGPKVHLLWGVESKEQLSAEMSIEDYARLTIPMMLWSYPSVLPANHSRYRLQALRYNYTGIHYSISDHGYIRSVDPDSPAGVAGIRPGDIVRKINGLSIANTITEEDNRYLEFIKQTAQYRDRVLPSLPSKSDAELYRYWDTSKYAMIAKLQERNKYMSPFVYLFSFRPYMSAKAQKSILFEIERGNETYTVEVLPQLRDESMIENI